jgi:thioredoxin 1
MVHVDGRGRHQQEAHMAHPITITDANFTSEVLESKVPVLVDFWASWCSPCKMIAPIVEDLTTEYEGRIKVGKVDVDANPATPGMFGIMSIPTLMVFQGGKAADRIVGYQPKPALKARLDAILTPIP